MLTELPDVQQEENDDARRRWFTGDDLELVVWQDDDGVRTYQLRYRLPVGDGVFEWRRGKGLLHFGLDDGEGRAARAKATPLLLAAEPVALAEVARLFERESRALEARLRDHVQATLAAPTP